VSHLPKNGEKYYGDGGIVEGWAKHSTRIPVVDPIKEVKIVKINTCGRKSGKGFRTTVAGDC
jgi:hypothetical protein